MNRKLSFYPDGDIDDVTDKPTAWHNGSDFQGTLVDGEAVWFEYQEKLKQLQEIERRLFAKMQIPLVLTDDEQKACDIATAEDYDRYR